MSETGTRRAVLTVFLVVFVDLLGFGILIPVIPLYAESFGATEFTASLLIASYSGMQFLFAPILGRISDERGRRPILLLSLSGSVIAWTLFALAEPLSSILGVANALWVLFAARMLAGAMGGNIATAQAYIADVTPPDERAKYLGLLGAAFGLGFVFGPALGAVFSSPQAIAFFDGLAPAWVPITEFTLPSFAAAGVTAANLLAAGAFLPESRPPEDRDAVGEDATEGVTARLRDRVDTLVTALGTRGLGALVISFFVVSFAFSALESQFVFFTKDTWNYGTNANAVLLTYVGLVVAVVQGGLIGPLTDRFGEYRLAVAGAGIQLATLASLPFAPELARLVPGLSAVTGSLPVVANVPPGVVVFLGILTVLSFGNAITNVSLNTLVSRSASEDTQGGAFGITQSAGSLARTVGPATAGALYTGVQYWTPFVVGGLLFLPVVYLLGGMDVAAIRPTDSQ